MIMNGLKWLMMASLAVGFTAAAHAEDFDAGKSEFLSSCASCHGTDGKGKGPVSERLKVAPPDLTVLAKKNNGVFPVSRVHEIIDGREALLTHGTREMPIWGFRYSLEQPPTLFNPEAVVPEAVVRARILSIIDYLNRIQGK